MTSPSAYGVGFSHKGTKINNDRNNDGWKNVPSVKNLERRDTLGPTFQTKREENKTTKKVQTRTRIRHVEKYPEQRKKRINPFNFYKTRIMKQVIIMTIHFINLVYSVLYSDMI